MNIEDLERYLTGYSLDCFGVPIPKGNSELSKAFKVIYAHMTIVYRMDMEEVLKRQFINPNTFKIYAFSAYYMIRIKYISRIYQGFLEYIISSQYELYF